MYIYWNRFYSMFIATINDEYANFSDYNTNAIWGDKRETGDRVKFNDGIAVIESDGSLRMTNRIF